MMTCHELSKRAADFLTGQFEPEEEAWCREHLTNCPACQEEIAHLAGCWAQLGLLTEENPSPVVRQRFYAMLQDHQSGRNTAGLPDDRSGPGKPAASFRSRSWWRMAAAALLLTVLGWTAARLTHPEQPAAGMAELASLENRITGLLLYSSSAGDRLQGIQFLSLQNTPDSSLLIRLAGILNHDPSVNVRMAAAGVLFQFREEPDVRERLLQSFARQDSPLVQLALVEFFINWNELPATQLLERISQDRRLNPAVSREAARALKQASRS